MTKTAPGTNWPWDCKATQQWVPNCTQTAGCALPLGYTCDGTGTPAATCVAAPGGKYHKASECEAACKPPIGYNCQGNNTPGATCVAAPGGKHHTPSECKAVCTKPVVVPTYSAPSLPSGTIGTDWWCDRSHIGAWSNGDGGAAYMCCPAMYDADDNPHRPLGGSGDHVAVWTRVPGTPKCQGTSLYGTEGCPYVCPSFSSTSAALISKARTPPPTGAVVYNVPVPYAYCKDNGCKIAMGVGGSLQLADNGMWAASEIFCAAVLGERVRLQRHRLGEGVGGERDSVEGK